MGHGGRYTMVVIILQYVCIKAAHCTTYTLLYTNYISIVIKIITERLFFTLIFTTLFLGWRSPLGGIKGH